MAKLIVVAELVALFAITQVCTSRTIITTTVAEEEEWSQQERCRQHIQRWSPQSFEQQTHPCQMHLSQQSESPQQQQYLQQCCLVLHWIDGECQCQAIQMAVHHQQQQQQERGQTREQQIRLVQRESELLWGCKIRC